MIRNYRYRLYPNKGQEKVLSSTLETCRRLYNLAREQRIIGYRYEHRSVRYIDQQNELTGFRKEDEYLNNVYSQVLQNVLRRVDTAYSFFFKYGYGYPRYKTPNKYHSFTYPQSTGFAIKNVNGKQAKLRLGSIGCINLRYHRLVPDEATTKTCTVVRKHGRWYAVISLDLPDVPTRTDTGNPVGIDVGLENYLTLSNGDVVENPRHYRKSQEKLAVEQRKLSTKVGSKKGQKKSNNYKKQSRQVSNVHEHIANQRIDYLHKLTRELVEKYPHIKVEKLQIKNMVRNHRLSKSIMDASWGTFFRLLVEKAESAGTVVEFVNPRGTSQVCWNCGENVPKELKDREHLCPYCGFQTHRDHNSSLVIRDREPLVGLGTSLITCSSSQG